MVNTTYLIAGGIALAVMAIIIISVTLLDTDTDQQADIQTDQIVPDDQLPPGEDDKEDQVIENGEDSKVDPRQEIIIVRELLNVLCLILFVYNIVGV